MKTKLISLMLLLSIVNLQAMINVKTIEKDQDFTVTLQEHKGGKGKMLLESEHVKLKRRDFLNGSVLFTYTALRKGYPFIEKQEDIPGSCFALESFKVNIADAEISGEELDSEV